MHIDVKKLGRVPPGGGHRLRGRAEARPEHRGDGYDYLHVAIDDRSRWAYVEVHPDERGETCAAFLRRTAEHFASLGIRIEAVMTDQAKNYARSRQFRDDLAPLEVRHLITRPYRPQTNGKVERFNRTMLDEWAYVQALPLEPGPPPGPPEVARDLQSPTTPHRARRSPAGLTALNNVSGNYS